MFILQESIQKALEIYRDPEFKTEFPIDWKTQTTLIFQVIAVDFYLELEKSLNLNSVKKKTRSDEDLAQLKDTLYICVKKAVDKYKCPLYGAPVKWNQWSKEFQGKFLTFNELVFNELDKKMNINLKRRKKKKLR